MRDELGDWSHGAESSEQFTAHAVNARKAFLLLAHVHAFVVDNMRHGVV